MQRAAFPELQGRQRPRHRRPQVQPDRVLTGLKIATVIAAGALLGVIILLTGVGAPEVAGRAPDPEVPKITPSPSDDDGSVTAPTTTMPTMIEAPAPQTEMTHIAGTPPPPPPPPPAPSPTAQPEPVFAVFGQPCPEEGMFFVTRDYQPAACYSDPPSAKPRWHPVF